MHYVCECGEKFNQQADGAREHMLEQHLDLVETRFDDFLDCALANEEEFISDDDLYDDAVDEITDELLDEFDDQ